MPRQNGFFILDKELTFTKYTILGQATFEYFMLFIIFTFFCFFGLTNMNGKTKTGTSQFGLNIQGSIHSVSDTAVSRILN